MEAGQCPRLHSLHSKLNNIGQKHGKYMLKEKEELVKKLLFNQTFPGGILATHIDGLPSGEICLFDDLI